MAIKLVVAVADSDWFTLLRQQPLLKEVNLWAPSDKSVRCRQVSCSFKLQGPIYPFFKAAIGLRLTCRFTCPVASPTTSLTSR